MAEIIKIQLFTLEGFKELTYNYGIFNCDEFLSKLKDLLQNKFEMEKHIACIIVPKLNNSSQECLFIADIFKDEFELERPPKSLFLKKKAKSDIENWYASKEKALLELCNLKSKERTEKIESLKKVKNSDSKHMIKALKDEKSLILLT